MGGFTRNRLFGNSNSVAHAGIRKHLGGCAANYRFQCHDGVHLPPKTKTKSERELHLSKVAEGLHAGKSIKQTAIELDRTGASISKDRRILRMRWAKKNTDYIQEEKFDQLEKLNRIEEEAWDAWDRSIGERSQTTRRVVQRNGVEERIVSETTETLAGDPRYLSTLNDVIRRRCSILGVDAPKEMMVDATTTLNVKAKLDLGVSDADRWIRELQSNGPIREAEVVVQARSVLPVGVRDETSGRESSVDTGQVSGRGATTERDAGSLGERAIQIHDHHVRADDTGHTEQSGVDGVHPVVQSTNGKSVSSSDQRSTGEQ